MEAPFLTRSDADETQATMFVGDYSYPRDMEIALRPSETTGNSFIYKTSPRTVRRPFRAFVFGVIKEIEYTKGEDAENAAANKAYRISLMCSPIAAPRGKALFANDQSVLQDIMIQEARKHVIISRPWAVEGQTASDSVIYVDCDDSTLHITREIEVGWPVVADASFHRHDKYIDNIIHTEYKIFAHTLEAIQPKYLQSVQVLQLDIATQDPEQVIARVQEEMEKMKIERA